MSRRLQKPPWEGVAGRTMRARMDRCRAGELTAEALPREARHHLIKEFHRRGWSDVEIATHLQMTTYTTARIRDDLGLPPNPMRPTGTEAA